MKRLLALLAVLSLMAGCSSASGSSTNSRTVTLVTHDAFAVSKNVLADFEKQSGLKVKVVRSSDAGTLVNQAILSKGHPQGDVLYGVDNTFLSRAVSAGIFTAYQPAAVSAVPAQFDLDKTVAPVDYGDVCVNYDKAWYTNHHLAPPQTFADLVKPAYKNQLVVENPATSSPGLAFLLGTVATYGQNGWDGWWKQLKSNGTLVVDSWDEAYEQRFTVGSQGKGTYPLVVSYASSPPAEVIYATKKPATAPTGVLTSTCFRQVEFAGLLAGAANPSGGKKLIDFLLSAEFQKDMPLQMFVFPVVPNTPLPAEFTKYAPVPAKPLSLSPAEISKNRDAWISQWTSSVLG